MHHQISYQPRNSTCYTYIRYNTADIGILDNDGAYLQMVNYIYSNWTHQMWEMVSLEKICVDITGPYSMCNPKGPKILPEVIIRNNPVMRKFFVNTFVQW